MSMTPYNNNNGSRNRNSLVGYIVFGFLALSTIGDALGSLFYGNVNDIIAAFAAIAVFIFVGAIIFGISKASKQKNSVDNVPKKGSSSSMRENILNELDRQRKISGTQPQRQAARVPSPYVKVNSQNQNYSQQSNARVQISKVTCPNCKYVTDTTHRFCGRCDYDFAKKNRISF